MQVRQIGVARNSIVISSLEYQEHRSLHLESGRSCLDVTRRNGEPEARNASTERRKNKEKGSGSAHARRAMSTRRARVAERATLVRIESLSSNAPTRLLYRCR